MKTLYITDLDGTLLTPEAGVSAYSVKVINALIDKGLHFTYSTARTSETAPVITKELNIRLPVILMNGVCVYDQQRKEFLHVETIESAAARQVIAVLSRHKLHCFLFSIKNNTLYTFYEKLGTPYMQSFYEERVKKFNKKFIQTNSFYNINDVVYISLFHKKEYLENAYVELKQITGIETVFYRDTYSEDLWYLEVASQNASKFSSARYIKEKFGFDKLVGFGDNLNDIPLFMACDECYAVENARAELKKIATGTIQSNLYNGVANRLSSLVNTDRNNKG